jgi:hypothetical protein
MYCKLISNSLNSTDKCTADFILVNLLSFNADSTKIGLDIKPTKRVCFILNIFTTDTWAKLQKLLEVKTLVCEKDCSGALFCFAEQKKRE